MSSAESMSDEDKLAGYAADLLAGLEAHTADWVEAVVRARVPPDTAVSILASLATDVDRALADVADLLAADIDAQRANPLAVMRSLVPSITGALSSAGVAAVHRDPDAERLFPDDSFDLTPGAFSDIHPDLHMPGLTWGAAKAHVHIQRRKAEGV